MSQLAEKIDLKDLSPSELGAFLSSFGRERYRTSQTLRWLYQKDVSSFEAMTNLSRRFRGELAQVSRISSLELMRVEASRDGTRKFLFRLEDGNQIESVLIADKDRLTLCISTQVGCALACRFCLTGTLGWKRQLRPSEIVNQVLAVRETLQGKACVTNIVLMGMGEPLANYTNTVRAIQLLAHPDAFKFSSRRVTLSTAGLVTGLDRLARERISFRLAVSLNAADDETRSLLMPINRRDPLKKLLEACRRFPLKPRTRITFEYVMIDGVNDSPEDAKRLLRLLRGIPSKVNLIPLNEASGIPFKRSLEENVRAFQEILMRGGLTAIVRASKGADISAACGQLQAKG